MKRFFTLVLGALAMVAVALISAFIAMRLAIHGREAVVPNFTGISVSDASKIASHKGLNLTLENRFYSTNVPAGLILAQDPAVGSRVRREWPVRITESLGPQVVNIPDLTGQTERAATVGIRRLSLELGTVAHLAVAGDPDIVLTQTPPANTGGVDGPRVSLLVSDPSAAEPTAYVMPALVGLTYGAASGRAASAGLHLITDTAAPITTPTQTPALPTPPGLSPSPAPVRPAASSIIASQNPQPGRRVLRGDAVHVTVAHPAAAIAAPPH
jgi:beta-lactam-binding protein with PASTA domain